MKISLLLLVALFGVFACSMAAPAPKALAAPGPRPAASPGGGRNSSSSSGGRGKGGSSSSSSSGGRGKGGSSSSSSGGRGWRLRGGKKGRRGGKIIKKKALFHTTYTHVPQYIPVDKYVKIPVPIPVPIPIRSHSSSGGSGGGSIIAGGK